MSKKIALITGVTGQDGTYLTQHLRANGYVVHGIMRQNHKQQPAPHHDTDFVLHYGDLTDSSHLMRLVQAIQPDEIYNLAAQSHVQMSFDNAEYTANTSAFGTLRILEAIRTLGFTQKTRFYQASTSELYGKTQTIPQNETTPFQPQSPYGVAKLYAYWITVNYREAYGIHASNGILFNHESPLREATFVTQKIATAVAAIAAGRQDTLFLGNLDAKRDWGHAKEYVAGMHAILQHKEGDDFVLATGRTETVRRFVELAFLVCDRTIIWEGTGRNEVGKDAKTGAVVVAIDPRHFRPTEARISRGDASKAKRLLGWQAKITLEDLAGEMVTAARDKIHTK